MGNLCSSGTDRTDKKEENRVPDKPRDGEDEALLATSGAELGVGPEGVQVPLEAEAGGGGSGDGSRGFLGEAVKFGESALTTATRTAQEEGQKLASTLLSNGLEAKDQIVEDVQTSVKASATHAAAGVVSAAEDAVDRGREDVEKRATNALGSVTGKLEETVGDVKNTFVTGNVDSKTTHIKQNAESDIETADKEADGLTSRVQIVTQAASSAVNSVKQVDGLFHRGATGLQSDTVQVHESGLAESIDLKSAPNVAAENTTATSVLSTQEGFFGNVKTQISSKAGELKATAESLTENIKQTAENKVNEAVESARQSATEAFASWNKSAPQKETSDDVEGIENSQNVPESRQDAFQKFSQSISNQVDIAAESTGNKFDASELLTNVQTSELLTNVQTSELLTNVQTSDAQPAESQSHGFENLAGSLKENLADSLKENLADNLKANLAGSLKENLAGSLEENVADTFTTVEDSLEQSVLQHFANLRPSHNDEDTATSVQEETVQVSVGPRISQNVIQQFNNEADKSIGAVEHSYDKIHQNIESREQHFQDIFSHPIQEPVTYDDVNTHISEAAGESIHSSDVNDHQSYDPFSVGFIENQVHNTVADVAEGVQTEFSREKDILFNESKKDSAQDYVSGVDFLEDATSLLQTHRNSLDGNRDQVPSVTITDQDVQDIEDNSEKNADSVNACHEATAREFVESIIEKATSMVSESMQQTEPSSESSSPSDPCVDRGEETLAPKKRGVMFVSPQISDISSSSLSSPQEMSPPPPHESDLSPPDDSHSSISQCELEEPEELLVAPHLPAEYSTSENNNNNNNILNNNAEDDDASIQRVAMEVTAKAVQDAIKIVADNGTGAVLNSNTELNNDVGVSSVSSPDEEGDEMTTTDSSQVERGSPVSDLTDTSAHGSVSESLSSYDPGAVFRQDNVNVPDVSPSSADNSTTVQASNRPASETNQLQDRTSDLMNFEDSSPSHGETPTPTNANSFDTYSRQPTQGSNDDPHESDVYPPPPLSSEVPFSFPTFDDVPTSPNKPTIVINSPDSAHHTNGSTEDLSSSQTEALI